MSELKFRWVFIPSRDEDPLIEEDLISSFCPEKRSALFEDGPCRWIRIDGLRGELAHALGQWVERECHLRALVFEASGLSRDLRVLLFEGWPSRLQKLLGPGVREDCAREERDVLERLGSWLAQARQPLAPWSLRKTGRSLSFDGPRPLIMGVVNVTPDSFSDGGLFEEAERAVTHAKQLCEEGVDVLDIGGESTRPGSESVDVQQELARVLPVIRELIAQEIPVPLSIDTTKAQVADAALSAGAEIVNDISMLRFDSELANVVSSHDAHLILMHSRHSPLDMQRAPHYDGLWNELTFELGGAVERALEAGIPRPHLAIDPGIGFGKRLQDNLRILRELPVLEGFGLPIVVGASRKSFLGQLLQTPPTQRLEGSLAAAAMASVHRAQFIRVHDVLSTRKLLCVLAAVGRPPTR